MATSKKLGQCTLGLDIIPSDVNDIPFPGDLIMTGRTDAAAVGAEIMQLPAGEFFSDVEIGDIVYNRTTRGAGYILAIHGSLTNVLVTAIAGTTPLSSLDFSSGSQDFEIYRSNGGYGRQVAKPCMVFPSEQDSTGGDGLRFTTAGGDIIGVSNGGNNVQVNLYAGTPVDTVSTTGSPFPFQVQKLWQTDDGGLIDNLDLKFYATW